jgi:hypothetical protein
VPGKLIKFGDQFRIVRAEKEQLDESWRAVAEEAPG